MIAIGILLLVVIAAITVVVILNGNDTATLAAFNVEVSTSVTGFFAIGAAVAVVALVGLWFIVAGISRSRRRHREMARLRRQADAAAARERTDQPADSEQAPEPAHAEPTVGSTGTEPTSGAHAAPTTSEPTSGAYGDPNAQPYAAPYGASPAEPGTGSATIPGQPGGERDPDHGADLGPAHR